MDILMVAGRYAENGRDAPSWMHSKGESIA